MSELGEPVAVGMIDTDDWECPFSHDKKGKVKNDLGNSSSKLGTRLTNGWSTYQWIEEGSKIKPKTEQKLLNECGEDDCPGPPVHVRLNMADAPHEYPFSRSAHHLIPADASLPQSHLLHYIKKGSIIDGDIGYDVNGGENGVWLPTHTALSRKMKEGTTVLPGETAAQKYGDVSGEGSEMVGSFVNLYAYAVMEHTNRQFHDAHYDYNGFVVKVLNKIQANLVVITNVNCKKCQEAKADNGKLPPPHRLVGRLNQVSERLKGYLLGGPSNWKLPIFTSPHARDFARDTVLWRQLGR